MLESQMTINLNKLDGETSLLTNAHSTILSLTIDGVQLTSFAAPLSLHFERHYTENDCVL